MRYHSSIDTEPNDRVGESGNYLRLKNFLSLDFLASLALGGHQLFQSFSSCRLILKLRDRAQIRLARCPWRSPGAGCLGCAASAAAPILPVASGAEANLMDDFLWLLQSRPGFSY